jgi:hypothetical protein
MNCKCITYMLYDSSRTGDMRYSVPLPHEGTKLNNAHLHIRSLRFRVTWGCYMSRSNPFPFQKVFIWTKKDTEQDGAYPTCDSYYDSKTSRGRRCCQFPSLKSWFLSLWGAWDGADHLCPLPTSKSSTYRRVARLGFCATIHTDS